MRTEPFVKIKVKKQNLLGKKIQLWLALFLAFVSVFFFFFKILFF
jgi:hypothetical protein